MMINGIDVSDPTRNFTTYEWNRLGWNGGREYVAQAWECMNIRGCGGRGRGRYGRRGYGCAGDLLNINYLNSNKGCGHDEGLKE